MMRKSRFLFVLTKFVEQDLQSNQQLLSNMIGINKKMDDL